MDGSIKKRVKILEGGRGAGMSLNITIDLACILAIYNLMNVYTEQLSIFFRYLSNTLLQNLAVQ